MSGTAPPDLEVSDEEIERLRAKAAERTSKPRTAYAELLIVEALGRAVDPTGALPSDERVERIARLRENLGPAGVAELLKAERSQRMSALAVMSARSRRARRVERLRAAAGEQDCS